MGSDREVIIERPAPRARSLLLRGFGLLVITASFPVVVGIAGGQWLPVACLFLFFFVGLAAGLWVEWRSPYLFRIKDEELKIVSVGGERSLPLREARVGVSPAAFVLAAARWAIVDTTSGRKTPIIGAFGDRRGVYELLEAVRNAAGINDRPNRSVPADPDPRERGSRPLNSSR